MTDNNERMMNAFRRGQAEIASLADWIECELDRADTEAERGNVTWADVGVAEDTKARLIEALSRFSGVEPDEIQRNLDELHHGPTGPEARMPQVGERLPDGSFPERNCRM